MPVTHDRERGMASVGLWGFHGLRPSYLIEER